MKLNILCIGGFLHKKNLHALSLYPNTMHKWVDMGQFEALTEDDLKAYDCVYSPSIPVQVSKYPNTRFIFGPHFNVFPDHDPISTIKGPHSTYIMPSQWPIAAWKTFSVCHDLDMQVVPFAVDTQRFMPSKPLSARTKVFVYYKSRNPNDLTIVLNVLNSFGVAAKVFQYGSYQEAEYLEYLRDSKYGIWVDAHESQGFALEEALAMDIPLLVWNITSMNQEYYQSRPDFPATTIPYWDERCGEVFYNVADLQSTMKTFLQKLESSAYSPRKFIEETLSPHLCEQRFHDVVFTLTSKT